MAANNIEMGGDITLIYNENAEDHACTTRTVEAQAAAAAAELTPRAVANAALHLHLHLLGSLLPSPLITHAEMPRHSS